MASFLPPLFTIAKKNPSERKGKNSVMREEGIGISMFR